MIDAGYDVEAEIEKILMDGCCDLADARLVDARAWTVKKIHRQVFTTGHGKLYQSDGRHHIQPKATALAVCYKAKNTLFT